MLKVNKYLHRFFFLKSFLKLGKEVKTLLKLGTLLANFGDIGNVLPV